MDNSVITKYKTSQAVKMKPKNTTDEICRTCLKKVDVPINIFKYLVEGTLISNSLKTCISLQVSRIIEKNICEHFTKYILGKGR